MIEIIAGPSGSGKSTLMFERIRAQLVQSDKQIVLVPEQYSYEFDKNLYFFLGAVDFNKLYSLSFTSLARQLFQLYGEPDRNGEYADDLARMILIYQAVDAARKSPGAMNFFRRQSEFGRFAEEVLKLINDMKRSGISAQKLAVKAVGLDSKLADKTNDVASVYFEYERLMKEYGFKDNLDNIREAAKIANFQQYFSGSSVYIDEFESFTGDQLEMLRVMISSAKNITITLRTDNVNAGSFTLFETVNTTYRTIAQLCSEAHKEMHITQCSDIYRFNSPDLKYLSTHVMRNFRYEPHNAPTPEKLRIYEARDMYSEAEFVCATIKRLIHKDSKLRYRDIAVISNNIERYAEVLKAAFARYDIPYFLSIERSVGHTSVMVFFTALLDLVTAKKFRTEQILRYLKCGLLGVDVTDMSVLENYCYKWGVDGNMWLAPFTADDDGRECAENLRQQVSAPLIKLKKAVSRELPAAEICSLLYQFIVDAGADKCLGRIMSRLIRENRDHEAAELKRLWGCLMDILDSIALTLDDKIIPFPELARIMRSMIGRLTYSVPPQTLDGVTTASARTARLNSPSVLFVMGCNEGDFPNQVSVHGLFSETDKRSLADNGIELSRPLSDLIASERLIVYKALSTASDALFLSYPLADLSGQVRYPAQVIDQTMKMFGSRDMLISESDITPDYYASTLHSAYYHYMQDRSADTRETASIREVLTRDPDYRRRLSRALSRSGYSQEYRIDRQVMERLKNFSPLRISSTGFENYNKCHFMYFCSECLKLRDCEKVELDSRIAGDLTHDCLHRIIASRSKADFLKMDNAQLCEEIGRCADAYRNEKLAGEFGKTPGFELVFNKLTERLARVFTHTQQALMASDFTPDAFELNLRDSHPVEIRFSDGHKLSFGGIIDRADTCTIGDKRYLRIIDYKSSQKQINASTLASGENMQMLLYLFAATESGGVYQDHFPAGVIYSPIQIGKLDTEEARIDSVNEALLDSKLKGSGLVLSDHAVLDSMEKGIAGRFIPAELKKDGSLTERSSCISPAGMRKLKDFTYGKLKCMAEDLLSGDAEAVPMVLGGKSPCMYCRFGDICGNSDMHELRTPDPADIAAAQEILGMKSDREEEV